MSEQLQELMMIVQAIFKVLNRSPSAYNKTDMKDILSGKKKGYTDKYKFEVSQCRLAGMLDLLELFKIVEKNEKGLYSVSAKGRETLRSLGVEV
jgi:capsule polysaccharide export protein KpsC/LpsZ